MWREKHVAGAIVDWEKTADLSTPLRSGRDDKGKVGYVPEL
jgi:hypothetical protein